MVKGTAGATFTIPVTAETTDAIDGNLLEVQFVFVPRGSSRATGRKS